MYVAAVNGAKVQVWSRSSKQDAEQRENRDKVGKKDDYDTIS